MVLILIATKLYLFHISGQNGFDERNVAILGVSMMKINIPMFGEVLRRLEEFWMHRSHVEAKENEDSREAAHNGKNVNSEAI